MAPRLETAGAFSHLAILAGEIHGQLASLILREDYPFDSGVAAALAPMSNWMTLVRLPLKGASRAKHDDDFGRRRRCWSAP
jgi:hypothetical protein